MLSNSLFASLGTSEGATSMTILFILLTASMILIKMTGLPIIQLAKEFIKLITRVFGKFINRQEEAYHRDIEIGKITEKKTQVKLYKFLSELIIDLNMIESGVTPYELLVITSILVFIVTTIVCKMLFASFAMTFVMTPIAIVGTFCVMYTKANIAHDARIENVIEAENIICNNIKAGVVVAVRESIDVIPKEIRVHFKDFLDNVEQKNYHIKTALLELNLKLGSVSDDFIKECIVFELEEEHGISGMFQDIVQINNINMEIRNELKRIFEECKTQFIVGASMIFIFLAGVIAIFENVRIFYFTTFLGHLLLAADVLLLILEFVYLTYLRAKEL